MKEEGAVLRPLSDGLLPLVVGQLLRLRLVFLQLLLDRPALGRKRLTAFLALVPSIVADVSQRELRTITSNGIVSDLGHRTTTMLAFRNIRLLLIIVAF